MTYIIFGGCGFIGTHLQKELRGERVIVADIVMPGEEGVVPGVVEAVSGVEYVRCDVRTPISLDVQLGEGDVVFDFAAVHRTPGHADREYFETNIRGAENVCQWAAEHGAKSMVFTSSIAPYGAAEELKTEDTLPTPNTPYGISKLVAEGIHKTWQAGAADRKLLIVRPGVVFGRGEHGNFTRLYWAIRRRRFAYPGRTDTIKACVYVKDLVGFMHWQIGRQSTAVETFNCTFEPAYTIRHIVETMKRETGLARRVPEIPNWLIMPAAALAAALGSPMGICPARVRKLQISTNICGRKLKESGYHFRYTLDEAIADWHRDCGQAGLK